MAKCPNLKHLLPLIFAFPLLIAAGPGMPSVSYLKVGEKAPPLSVDLWIKGDSLQSFVPGHVYVVEFWGTWCAPCVENIPHLNDLQKTYRKQGVTVLGVASHEFNGLEPLRKFVGEKGDAMNYTIAYDSDLSMEHAWQTHGEKDVVFRMPEAFIVGGDGTIVWKGHPTHQDEMKQAIESAIAKSANTK